MARSALIDLLERDGAVDAAALESAKQAATQTGRSVGMLLLERGLLDESSYAQYLAESIDVPFFSDAQIEAADGELASLLSAKTAGSMALVVIGQEGDALLLASADADNVDRLGAVEAELGRPVKFGLASRSAIAVALEHHYGVEGTTLWVDPGALQEALAQAGAAAAAKADQATDGPDGGFPGDADPTLEVGKKEVKQWLESYRAGKSDEAAAGDTEKTEHPGAVPRHPDEEPITEPVWHDEAPMDAPTVGLIVEPGALDKPDVGETDQGLPAVAGQSLAATAEQLEAVQSPRRAQTDEIKKTVQGFVPAGGFKRAPTESAGRSLMEEDTAIDRRKSDLTRAEAEAEAATEAGGGTPAAVDDTGGGTPAAVDDTGDLAEDRPLGRRLSASPAQAFSMGPTAEQAPSGVKVVTDPVPPRQPAPSRPPPPRPGARFRDRYQFIDKLGVGGMAEVWRARVLGAQGFRRMVVVKKILPEYTMNREFVEMFIDEAKIACRLSHPNIAQIYELAEEDGEFFMVMEYVDGPDLATVYERATTTGPPLPPSVSAHIVEQICAGLEYAHRATDDQGIPLDIVHRDITPHNVLVSYEGHVKIIDFGIAKAAQKVSVTRVGYMKGKPGYIAPEQALGMTIDHRLDIFSAGIILTELLTHERLFPDSTDPAELRKLAVFDPRPILRWKLRLPGPLRASAIRALQVRPADRFQTAREFGQALRSWGRKRKADPQDELSRYLATHLPPVGGWEGPSG